MLNTNMDIVKSRSKSETQDEALAVNLVLR